MNKHVGSGFESWLERRGLREDVRALAAKKIIVGEIVDAMKARNVSKSALAIMMETERPAIHRLLDPNESGLTLNTIIKAMHVLEIPTLTIVGSAAFAAKPKASKQASSKKDPQSRKPKPSPRALPRIATVHELNAKKAAPASHIESTPQATERYAAIAGGMKRVATRRGATKIATSKTGSARFSSRAERSKR
jgi:antitoxin HicB